MNILSFKMQWRTLLNSCQGINKHSLTRNVFSRFGFFLLSSECSFNLSTYQLKIGRSAVGRRCHREVVLPVRRIIEAANICQPLNSLRTGASHLDVDPIIISVRTQNRYDFRTIAMLLRISAKDLRRREFSFGTGCLQSAVVNERLSAYLLCEIYQCIHPLNVIVRVKLNRTATISHLLTRRASRVVLMEASIEPVVTCC